jgi:antitoxin ParD1/3/4
MSMTSLNISLPSSLKEFVETTVQENGFSTPSEYIRNLVRDDQKRRTEEKLEILLLEGLNSGEPIEISAEYWEKKRIQLLERHKNKTGKR